MLFINTQILKHLMTVMAKSRPLMTIMPNTIILVGYYSRLKAYICPEQVRKLKEKASSCFLEVSGSPGLKRKTIEMHDLICKISIICQFEHFNACDNLRERSTEFCVNKFLKYISGPDALAQELKYHKHCFTSVSIDWDLLEEQRV